MSGDLHLRGMWGKEETGVHIFMNKDFMGSKTPWAMLLPHDRARVTTTAAGRASG